MATKKSHEFHQSRHAAWDSIWDGDWARSVTISLSRSLFLAIAVVALSVAWLCFALLCFTLFYFTFYAFYIFAPFICMFASKRFALSASASKGLTRLCSLSLVSLALSRWRKRKRRQQRDFVAGISFHAVFFFLFVHWYWKFCLFLNVELPKIVVFRLHRLPKAQLSMAKQACATKVLVQ